MNIVHRTCNQYIIDLIVIEKKTIYGISFLFDIRYGGIVVSRTKTIGTEIAIGEELYASACRSCHGGEAAARFGGSVPDLRFANAETHATWHAIVVGGSRSANGMPSIEIPIEESEAIRNYVLAKSEEIRAAQ